MRMKPILRETLLSFFENHRRVETRAVYAHFEQPNDEIDAVLSELEKTGWIKINKSYTDKGYTITRPIVVRTDKTLYAQPNLFELN